MTPAVNLHILAKRFTQLSRSAYFDSAFKEFSQSTVGAINHVIANLAHYPEDVVRQFEAHVWRVMQFVRGSRSSDAPHETQFVLRKALSEWIPISALISSAALEELNFFLNTADLWDFVDRTLNLYDAKGYKPLVVRIGSPEAFKHRPVFCVPLFHELGHFVDYHHKVSELSMLIAPITPPPQGMHLQTWQAINLSHRMEFFADLFASCYCGDASNKSLLAIAPGNPDSPSHPSTARRVATVADFLVGRPNPMVTALQNALTARGLQNFSTWFLRPDLGPAFNDVLTYRIADKSELYGIFPAGWDYLHDQLATRAAPWIYADVDDYAIETTINDLVEKSIRNFEIRERWANVAPNAN